jgi:hypothetical protein
VEHLPYQYKNNKNNVWITGKLFWMGVVCQKLNTLLLKAHSPQLQGPESEADWNCFYWQTQQAIYSHQIMA